MLSGVRLAAAPASAPSYVIAAAHRRAAAAPASPCYLAQHVTPSNGISAASAMSTVVLSALGASLGNRMVKEAHVKTMTSSGGRSISCTAARATGLNDFFVSFPDVDKDGKPMYPAVGAPAAVFMTRRWGLAFLSTLSMLCDFAVFFGQYHLSEEHEKCAQDVRGKHQNCGKSHSKTCTSCGGFCSKNATALLLSVTLLAPAGILFFSITTSSHVLKSTLT